MQRSASHFGHSGPGAKRQRSADLPQEPSIAYTAPSPQGPPFWCDVCRISTTDYNGLQAHLQGKQHKKKSAALNQHLGVPPAAMGNAPCAVPHAPYNTPAPPQHAAPPSTHQAPYNTPAPPQHAAPPSTHHTAYGMAVPPESQSTSTAALPMPSAASSLLQQNVPSNAPASTSSIPGGGAGSRAPLTAAHLTRGPDKFARKKYGSYCRRNGAEPTFAFSNEGPPHARVFLCIAPLLLPSKADAAGSSHPSV
ncbi:hypothetical protein CYMTET_48755 [Cymbomonas tetramitiformis]|uniref:U1-type domain-containing protein n=1 Tax=Cymbomonas tetramitiformis TaxID=36881 RepID=A0AAE0BRK4_9CHLO|nr:hypothetical protein CYMTET_48755 [Cymbomonas tetramitiformis]